MDSQMDVDTSQITSSAALKRKADVVFEAPNVKDSKSQSDHANKHTLTRSKVNTILSAIDGAERTRYWGLFSAEERLTLVFCGKTSSTKSTMIEQLLEIGGSLPKDDGPCTMEPVQISIIRPAEMATKYKNQKPDDVLEEDWKGPKYEVELADGGLFRSSTQIPFYNTEEVCAYFKKRFLSMCGKPDYTKILKLRIADAAALQLVVLDTPGSRLENVGSWVDLTENVAGCTPYCVVFTAYDKCDMARDDTLSALAARWRPKMKTLRLLVVISKIDELDPHDKAAAGRFVDFLGEVKKLFAAAAELQIAVSQGKDPKTVDPTQYELHRVAERKTIDNLPRSIKNFDGLILGVDEIRNFILGLYVKMYNVNKLINIQKGMSTQLAQKEAELETLSGVTKPAEKAKSIGQDLSNYQSQVEECEFDCKEILQKAIIAHSQSANLESTRVKNKGGKHGHHDKEFGEEDLKKAKKIAKENILALTDFFPSMVNKILDSYRNFLSSRIEIYKKRCPQMYDLVMDLWTSYSATKKKETIKMGQKTIIWASNGLCLQSNALRTQFGIIPPDCAYMRKPIGVEVAQHLEAVLDPWLMNFVGMFITHYFEGFGDFLNVQLSNNKSAWPAAPPDMIASLEAEVEGLRNSIGPFDDAIAALQME